MFWDCERTPEYTETHTYKLHRKIPTDQEACCEFSAINSTLPMQLNHYRRLHSVLLQSFLFFVCCCCCKSSTSFFFTGIRFSPECSHSTRCTGTYNILVSHLSTHSAFLLQASFTPSYKCSFSSSAIKG